MWARRARRTGSRTRSNRSASGRGAVRSRRRADRPRRARDRQDRAARRRGRARRGDVDRKSVGRRVGGAAPVRGPQRALRADARPARRAVDRARYGDPEELTAQEVRVARAVARGGTNREVAAELFLSPKTIDFHLGRVYRKLDIHSRAELATLVAEGRLDQAEV
ncbi:MAG TPA: helix-turn-helix transcriptional regulator [Solirubrobacterales bacterium]|nr:helix-turn-helix transcriptional regulator [Solirubrobacterales bacterium]